MSYANIKWGWGIVWVLAVALLAFLWLPGIKSFTSKWFSLNDKVDKALVQYDEFKQTIYPLLEFTLGQLVGNRYMSSPPKTEVLLDFLPRVRRVIEQQNYNDLRTLDLYEAAKSITLEEFATEMNLIVINGLNLDGNTEVLELIHNGLSSDYSSSEYVYKDQISIEFDKLKKYEDKLSGSYKERFHKKMKELKMFYSQYF